jgi:hypothetical protein
MWNLPLPGVAKAAMDGGASDAMGATVAPGKDGAAADR